VGGRAGGAGGGVLVDERTSVDASASAPRVLPSSPVAPPAARSALDVLVQSSKVYVEPSFRGATKWSLHKLVEEAAKQNVDISEPTFGTAGTKHDRSNAKQMLMIMAGHATIDEKLKLKPARNAATESVTSNIEAYSTVSKSIVAKVIASLEAREAVVVRAGFVLRPKTTKADEEGTTTKPKTTRKPRKARKGDTTVGSVLKRFGNVKKAEICMSQDQSQESKGGEKRKAEGEVEEDDAEEDDEEGDDEEGDDEEGDDEEGDDDDDDEEEEEE
jgi:hypothetical protein